jgi:hypothetical protein
MIASSSSGAVELKLQTLTGAKAFVRAVGPGDQTPFYIYGTHGAVSFEAGPGRERIAEIWVDERRDYLMRAHVPAILDATQLEGEARIGHCSKISFLGKYSSKDGGHILVAVFSRDYTIEKGLESHVAGPKSLFQPQRKAFQAPRLPMEARILNQKWMYEEREHLK